MILPMLSTFKEIQRSGQEFPSAYSLFCVLDRVTTSSCCKMAANLLSGKSVLVFCLTILVITRCFSATIKTKILVLGAGSAGVGFANTLLENGERDFLVLDAQNYVGGRIRNAKLGSLTIQAGAGWIHDIGPKNPYYVMKTKMGLQATADDYSDFIVRYFRFKNRHVYVQPTSVFINLVFQCFSPKIGLFSSCFPLSVPKTSLVVVLSQW